MTERMKFQVPASSDNVTMSDLWQLTNQVIDEVERALRRCIDADVTFVPIDPLANDPLADAEHEAHIAWTLGHIIVHTTASAEEAAALAAESARGIAYHGRSRHEVPWETMTTVAQCRARLEESRRLRLASLSMWPDSPHQWEDDSANGGATEMRPTARFLSGLRHDAGHLDQVRDAINQARDYRFQQTLLGRLRRRLWRNRPAVPAPSANEHSEK